MASRVEAFEAGCLLVQTKQGLRRGDHRLAAFFAQPGLKRPTGELYEIDDIALTFVFRELPDTHLAIQAWFNVGLQYQQWTPRIAFAKEDEVRWALVATRFTDSLVEAGVDSNMCERLYRLFAIADESELYVEEIRMDLSVLAAKQDEEHPLRELSELPVHIGSLHMGDNYSANQAGAMGPGAHAHDMTFQQVWQQAAGKLNLNDLANELAKLRKELRAEASEPDHDIALGEVAAAESAARSGNGEKALAHLKQAGSWVFDVATKIGVSLATEALKTAIGLPAKGA